MLAITAGAVLGGVVGAFLAVPLTAVAVPIGAFVRQKERTERITLLVAMDRETVQRASWQ